MIELSGRPLTLDQIAAVAQDLERVTLTPDAIAKMAESRAVIERIVAQHLPVYGVNTGFGRLSDVKIPDEDLSQLQLNLVRSHACGVGEPLSEPETRAMMLLRANVLACGFSGARPVLAETLVKMLNAGVHPVVPARGSVGASGDLAPLAHLALVTIGEGEAMFLGARMPGDEAMRTAGIETLVLEAKEGLALLNGTQAIGAVGSLALHRALQLLDLATQAGAMSLEALRDTPAAFDPRIQQARPHRGQIEIAQRLLELMAGSEIRESHRENDTRVQDAYSIRCMPQVHGAVLDVLRHVQGVLEIESGSGTDNPLVFPGGDVISGGNFHGAPLAYALDYAAIALTDLGGISERRIERLVNPDLSEGLPPFLSREAGIGSGFMMAQVTAVALLNECKVLSHPASTDNMPTSGGKEDHVSMGMTSALKFRQIVDNVERIIAIELMAGAEGLEHRKPLKPGTGVQKTFELVRDSVPELISDRALGPDIDRLSAADL
jgi:histidine ammonia-lyase